MPFFSGIILAANSPVTNGQQQNCTGINCYIKLGTATSRLNAYRRCYANGYQPVKIHNKEMSRMISEKFTNFWLNIQSHDPGYYSYVNGNMYHAFGEYVKKYFKSHITWQNTVIKFQMITTIISTLL